MTTQPVVEAPSASPQSQQPETSTAKPPAPRADEQRSLASELVKKHLEGRQGVSKPASAAAPPATAPEDVAKTAPKAEAKPAATKTPLSEDEQAAYEGARHALRWAKVPTSVINAMDPRDLIKWGDDVAKVRSRADDETRQLAELRKQTPPAAEAKPPTSAPTAPALELDFSADVQALSKVDPEAGQALASALKGVAPKLQAQMQAVVAKAIEDLPMKRIAAAVTRLEMQAARSELAEKFPQLRDSGKFQSVIDKMAKIGNPNFADYRELMEEASAIVFVNDMAAKSQQDELQKEHRERDSGQGDKPRTPAPKTTLTPKQAEREALTEIMRQHGYSMTNS